MTSQDSRFVKRNQHTAHSAVEVLQRGVACDAADAKAAWNDYVLRYVDGQPKAGRDLLDGPLSMDDEPGHHRS